MRLHRNCNAMGDIAKISPRIPSTSAQNAILSLLIIHIDPSRQIYMAIDNPLLVLSVSCLITSSYLSNYVRAANDDSHSETMQSNGCRCMSHLYKFRNRIQVTQVFRYCGKCQGKPVPDESSILVLELDFESSLQLPRETPIQHDIIPRRVSVYPHLVILSIPSARALASCASTHLRYAFAF